MRTVFRLGLWKSRAGVVHCRSAIGTVGLGCLCLLLAGCDSGSVAVPGVELHGAGSSFPAPLYERWFSQMAEEHPGLLIKYEEIGSGSGVQQFIDEVVDFAASDDPLTDEEIAQVDRGVRQMPMTSGAIVFAYNLRDANGDRITELRLSRKAYSGIFLGEIRSWRDEEIARHNPNLALPDLPIQVEYRLDSSGTTSALTRHLTAISEEWSEGPGIGKTVIWPVGAGMPKNDGVIRGVNQVPGAIGYVSYTSAKEEGLPMAILQNQAGSFVAPSIDSIRLGLSGLRWSVSESRAFVTDPIDDGAYPIVTYSWILCYRVYDDPEKLAILKELITYGLGDGQQFSGELGYVELMDVVAENAVTALDAITLPQSADTSTSIQIAKTKPDSDSLSESVIEMVEEIDGVAPQESEVPMSKLSDVQADDVSVQDAAAEQEDDVSVQDAASDKKASDDASLPEDQQRGES